MNCTALSFTSFLTLLYVKGVLRKQQSQQKTSCNACKALSRAKLEGDLRLYYSICSSLSSICFKSNQVAYISTVESWSDHFYLLCQEEQAEDHKTDCDCEQINVDGKLQSNYDPKLKKKQTTTL